MRRRRRLAVAVAALLAATAACRRPTPPAADARWLAELQRWRRERLERLAAPDGWLTLVALVWLEPGVHTVGSDPQAGIRLPDPRLPAVVGTLELDHRGRVLFRVRPGTPVLVDGRPATEAELRPDVPGPPTLVSAGRITFHVIRRGDRLAVRVKDPRAPTRVHFRGLDWYPPDPAFRVRARLVRFPQPRPVHLATVVGTDETMLAPGELRFTLARRRLSLLPLVERPGDTEAFVVFRDRTSGDTTYGAGRFLDVPLPPAGDEVELDFNRAYNPPCAFTPYATCPLPPPENELPVRIEAGERTPPGHG